MRGLTLGVMAVFLIGGAVLWNRRPAQTAQPAQPAQPAKPAESPRDGAMAPSGPIPRLPAGVTPTPAMPQSAEMIHFLRARAIQKMFAEHGYTIQCAAVEAKHMLVVAGPSVDREFMEQFVNTPPLLKGIRESGFTVIGFWHGPYLTGAHIEDFPLPAPAASGK